jgi:hypothetical protein
MPSSLASQILRNLEALADHAPSVHDNCVRPSASRPARPRSAWRTSAGDEAVARPPWLGLGIGDSNALPCEGELGDDRVQGRLGRTARQVAGPANPPPVGLRQPRPDASPIEVLRRVTDLHIESVDDVWPWSLRPDSFSMRLVGSHEEEGEERRALVMGAGGSRGCNGVRVRGDGAARGGRARSRRRDLLSCALVTSRRGATPRSIPCCSSRPFVAVSWRYGETPSCLAAWAGWSPGSSSRGSSREPRSDSPETRPTPSDPVTPAGALASKSPPSSCRAATTRRARTRPGVAPAAKTRAVTRPTANSASGAALWRLRVVLEQDELRGDARGAEQQQVEREPPPRLGHRAVAMPVARGMADPEAMAR